MNLTKIIVGIILVSSTVFGEMTKKEKLTCIQMSSINMTLKMFKLNNKAFPTTDEGLHALIENPDEKKYPNYFNKGYFFNKKVPLDMWHNSFHYKLSEDTIHMISSGDDGIAGNGDDIHFPSCLSE